MSDTQEVLLLLTEHMETQHNYFFNLIDVLAKKHIITKKDLEYIRNHKDTKEQNNEQN